METKTESRVKLIYSYKQAKLLGEIDHPATVMLRLGTNGKFHVIEWEPIGREDYAFWIDGAEGLICPSYLKQVRWTEPPIMNPQ